MYDYFNTIDELSIETRLRFIETQDIRNLAAAEMLSSRDFEKGNESVVSKKIEEKDLDTSTVEGQIIKILETKIRPAVARDGGDIKFKEFKDGIVRVELQGACSGCPSAALTLKQGVQNLLCHYVKEVKSVEAI